MHSTTLCRLHRQTLNLIAEVRDLVRNLIGCVVYDQYIALALTPHHHADFIRSRNGVLPIGRDGIDLAIKVQSSRFQGRSTLIT